MSRFKLGRKALIADSRTLSFGKYSASLSAPPVSSDWTKGQTSYGMMENDQIGDCTIAACGHAIQVWTANTSGEITVPDPVIENIYSWWAGYVPGDPNTDNGAIPVNVLSSWRKHGFNGNKLKAFVAPSVQNLAQIKQAIDIFGGVYIGLNISNYLMNNGTAPGSIWDVVPNDEGIDGGHAVFCPAYDADTITCISWGSLYHMTNAFWAEYVDESYALLSPEWFTVGGPSASGFAFNDLWSDLASL